jgi:hypothetical protein
MTQTSVLSADAEAALIALLKENEDQGDLALARPLTDWSQWLEAEGYWADGLETFFLNPDLLQHWQGETSLTALYDRALTEGQTTGQFIDALKDLEPAYLEKTRDAADHLLADTASLMDTAGGTGRGLNQTNLSSGAKWGIRGVGTLAVLGVGGGIGYALYKHFKKSDAINPEKIADNLEKEAVNNTEKKVEDVFGGKSKYEDAKILVKKDLEFQAKKFSEVTEKIETKTREGLDDYERNHKVLIETIEKLEKGKVQIMDAFKEEGEQELKELKAELKDLQDHPDKIFKSEFNLEFQHSKYGSKLFSLAKTYEKPIAIGDIQRFGASYEKLVNDSEDAALAKAKKLHGPDLVKSFTDEKMQQYDENFKSMTSDLEEELDSDMKESLKNITTLIEKNAQNKLVAEIEDETGVLFGTAEEDAIKTVSRAAKNAEENLVTDVEDSFENKVDGLEDDMV